MRAELLQSGNFGPRLTNWDVARQHARRQQTMRAAMRAARLPSAVALRIACSCGTRLLSSAGPHRVPSRSLPAEVPSLRDFMQPSEPSEIGDANPAPYIDPGRSC
jgi:hypothetical protein